MKISGKIRRGWAGALCGLVLACFWVPAAIARPQSSSTTSSGSKAKTATKKKHHRTAASASSGKAGATTVASKGKRSARRPRGQQKIDSERAQSIQTALIRAHYLGGEPTGTWNQASEDAMRRYQADHGWQSKTVPDSRALIKLGLGPSHDHLLNPESAMTTVPDGPRATSLNPSSHSADPVSSSSKTPAANPPAATSTTNDLSRPQ